MTDAGSGLDGTVTSAHVVAAFLADALQVRLSAWTVANVLREWCRDGTTADDVEAALGTLKARRAKGEVQMLLDDYLAIDIRRLH